MYQSGYLLQDMDLIGIIAKNEIYFDILFIIPEIVVDETYNKLNEEIEDINDNYRKLKKSIQRFSDESTLKLICPNDYIIAESEKAKMQMFVKKRIQQIGEIINYPKVSHKEVVARALQRKKPFDSKGENGYRDTIIWETIKEAIMKNRNDDFFFICQNTSDFFNKDLLKNHVYEHVYELDKKLKKELSDIGFNCSKFKCYLTFKDFFEKELRSSLENIEELKLEKINKDISTQQFLLQFQRKIDQNIFNKNDFKNEIKYSYDGINLNYIGLEKIINISNVKIFNETAIMNINCKFEYSLDLYIFKRDYYLEEDKIGDVEDLNEYYFLREENGYIEKELLVTYEIENETIVSISK